ncbi:hypothetical protein F4824DRAFT_443797 [Ustulina deusta]|nr:hypothetical protein F4824DRAFT_443797 [Ustulina deusta]
MTTLRSTQLIGLATLLEFRRLHGRVGSSQIRSGQDRHCPKDNLDVQMPNYITPPRSQHLLYRYAKHLSCSAQ